MPAPPIGPGTPPPGGPPVQCAKPDPEQPLSPLEIEEREITNLASDVDRLESVVNKERVFIDLCDEAAQNIQRRGGNDPIWIDWTDRYLKAKG